MIFYTISLSHLYIDFMKNVISCLTQLLIIVGGLNWGLVGAFNFDLVAFLLSSIPVLQKLVYVLVGVSAAVQVVFLAQKGCK